VTTGLIGLHVRVESLSASFPATLLTPPDPRTGRTGRLFDAIDWAHAIST